MSVAVYKYARKPWFELHLFSCERCLRAVEFELLVKRAVGDLRKIRSIFPILALKQTEDEKYADTNSTGR